MPQMINGQPTPYSQEQMKYYTPDIDKIIKKAKQLNQQIRRFEEAGYYRVAMYKETQEELKRMFYDKDTKGGKYRLPQTKQALEKMDKQSLMRLERAMDRVQARELNVRTWNKIAKMASDVYKLSEEQLKKKYADKLDTLRDKLITEVWRDWEIGNLGDYESGDIYQITTAAIPEKTIQEATTMYLNYIQTSEQDRYDKLMSEIDAAAIAPRGKRKR